MPTSNDGTIITQNYPLLSVTSNLPPQISFWNFYFHFFLLFFGSEFLRSIEDPCRSNSRGWKRPRHRNTSSQGKHYFWKHGESFQWDHAKNTEISATAQIFLSLRAELFQSLGSHIFNCSFWPHCQDPGCLMCPEDSDPDPHPWQRGLWRCRRSPGRKGMRAGRGRRRERSLRCGRKPGTPPTTPTLSCWQVAWKQTVCSSHSQSLR